MRAWFAAALVLLFAGCTEPEAELAPPVAEAEPEEPVAGHFAESYEFLLTAVKTPATSHNAGGQNCLMLDDSGTITGTATASWTPDPGMPEMELLLSGSDDLVFRTGDGSIVLEFEGFEVGGGGGSGALLVWQASQGAAAGAFVEGTATLDLDLEFVPDEAGDEFDPEEGWTCSIGH